MSNPVAGGIGAVGVPRHIPPNVVSLSYSLRALGLASAGAADAEAQLCDAALAHAKGMGPALTEAQLLSVQVQRVELVALLRATISELDLALVMTAGLAKPASGRP